MKKVEPHYIIVEGKRLPLIVKKHPRARSIVVSYDARGDFVRVTLPRRARVEAGIEFARSKAQWVAVQMARHSRTVFAHGMKIPLFGETVEIVHAGGRGVVRREEEKLYVPGEAEFLPRRVRDYVKQQTKEICEARAKHHAGKLGVSYRTLSVRETTSRWGSCSARGAISICWRLAFAPLEVLDYIVAHEIAHCKHHNHGKAYWEAVASLCPDYEQHERWLARHGIELWGWGA